MTKIAAGLERAFATQGFAEPSVEDLRDAAGVSLRTLYKYAPSRSEMVYAALEHRHRRYLSHMFDDLPATPSDALPALMDRVGSWMRRESSHGCLFHTAVAAAPGDERLRKLLQDHKADVAFRGAGALHLVGHETELMIILEGLTQSWPLHGDNAVQAAKHLGAALMQETSPA
ncbi:TetR/AcrR family transcriptional regulator [Pacificispira spongiicola]|nr:TetR/AcrR family transcriptional regulator [Pacificispira spongiicola]